MPTDTASAASGLSTVEAGAILAADGPNRVEKVAPPRLAYRIGRQLTDPLVALLLASAIVTLALRDLTDTLVIALVVVVNTTIGVTQEVRADRAIAALDRLAAPVARVVRDGVDQLVPAAEVVRGDLVLLGAGDVVPADLRLGWAERLRLDEAALTGESVPVDRGAGQEAYAGTVVLTGRARGTVVRVGAASALGRIASLVASTRPGPTPLQRRLNRLGQVLGAAIVALSAVIMVLGLIAGRPLEQMAITAVSLVVAAVPESLPAVVTLALALGAYRMTRGHAIARRLHAVETLGSVTVLASDKTGTLTEGRMAVDRAVTCDGRGYRVVGQGYEPTGEVHAEDGGVLADRLRELATAGALCNDATLTPPDDAHPRWGAIGDPLEAALVAFAERCGIDVAERRAELPRVAEQPFDAATRRMVTVHRAGGDALVICKGAPEVVFGDVLDPATTGLTELVRAARDLADAGLRVIAVAARRYPRQPPGDPATGLRPLGVVGVGDPLRPGAAEVAASFDRAGVRLVLVTGDHPATAAAIAGRLGIAHRGDEVVSGDEGLPEERAQAARVFARIRPEQKLTIVTELQHGGNVVAMTGDGVNDAPALRRADIGVAMGGGTEVARQAADLVLTDDNLATVGTAIGEGRRVYDNIRRFLRYGLSGGFAEIAVMLTGPFVGLAVPLLPAQILWVNLLTHGLPGVALGAEPAAPDVLRRPPRSPQESVLGAGLGRAVLATGALISVGALGAGVVAQRAGHPAWQSMIFVVLGLAQLGVALAVAAPRRRGRPGNPSLFWAVALSAVLQVAGVLVGPLRTLLGTQPLTWSELGACALVAAVPGVVLGLGRALSGGAARRARSPTSRTSGPGHGGADAPRSGRKPGRKPRPDRREGS
ncbi:MAG TPA: cation-transporting P-type ATPase [Micromonosporaceae bacterium]